MVQLGAVPYPTTTDPSGGWDPSQVGASNTGGNNFGPQTSPSASAPDMWGTGMFRPSTFNIDQSAFNNPAGNLAPAYNTQLGNYLPATTTNNMVNAATSGAVRNPNTTIAGQLGAAQLQGNVANQQGALAGAQGQLARQYANMAAGGGPSLATVTAEQQGAQSFQQANSMLASARGAGNPAAAQLASRNALTQGQQQVAQNAVAGRTAEEMAAMGGQGAALSAQGQTLGGQAGTYGNVANTLGNVGGQQLSGAAQTLQNQQFNASQTNAARLANQANITGANTNMLNNLSAQDLAQMNANMAGQQLGVQQQLGLNNIQMQAYQNAAKQNQSVGGGIMGAAGAALGALAIL